MGRISPKVVIVEATEDDMARFFGPLAINAQWRAKAAKRGDLVVGIGGAIEGMDGTWTGFMNLSDRVRTPSLFRHALRLIDEVRGLGCEAIQTPCDDAIPRASAFLRRLGFEPTEETAGDKVIWRGRT